MYTVTGDSLWFQVSLFMTKIDTYPIISNTTLAAKASHLPVQENIRNQVLIEQDDAALLTEFMMTEMTHTL